MGLATYRGDRALQFLVLSAATPGSKENSTWACQKLLPTSPPRQPLGLVFKLPLLSIRIPSTIPQELTTEYVTDVTYSQMTELLRPVSSAITHHQDIVSTVSP